MSLPTALAAYEDCIDTFDRAVSSSKGVRNLFDNHSKAMYFRMRMSQARVLMRAEAKRMYDESDPRYGKSVYDGYVCTIKPAAEPDTGKFWVYIEPNSSSILATEEIEDVSATEVSELD